MHCTVSRGAEPWLQPSLPVPCLQLEVGVGVGVGETSAMIRGWAQTLQFQLCDVTPQDSICHISIRSWRSTMVKRAGCKPPVDQS